MRKFWLLALSVCSVAHALAFKEAPTLIDVLQAGGGTVAMPKVGTLAWELNGLRVGVGYREMSYAPFMEPGYRFTYDPKKVAGQRLEDMKPPEPLGNYLMGVMFVSAADEPSRKASQKLAETVMAQCYSFTDAQLSHARAWIRANRGKQVTRTFGQFSVALDSVMQGGVKAEMMTINFGNFGGPYPNSDGWNKFCRTSLLAR